MQDSEICVPTASSRKPWNKGKLIGAKPPLRPKPGLECHLASRGSCRVLGARTRKSFAQRDILRKPRDEYMFSGTPSTADGSQTCRLFRLVPSATHALHARGTDHPLIASGHAPHGIPRRMTR
jgi:hypothetical protein